MAIILINQNEVVELLLRCAAPESEICLFLRADP
jgi:hypothetical protein